MSDTNLQIRVLDSVSQIQSKTWDTLTGTTNPFTKHAFYAALEQSKSACPQTGWQPCHFLLEDKVAKALGLMPAYVKNHSYGEYVFDQSWAHAYEHAGGQYYPKLQMSVPFTPATGPRIFCQSDYHAQALIDGAVTLCNTHGISGFHMTFLNTQDHNRAQNAGLLIRYDEQFHWENKSYQNFEHFLGALSSRKRKAIRKERKQARSDISEIKILTGREIEETHWDSFYTFYLETAAKKWGTPYLNREFFSLIGESMSQETVLILAYRAGVPIAGALNFMGDNTLFGRYWGAVEHHPYLHFELCYYQAIDFAIQNKLKTVEAGAQGAHKIARGYEPKRTYSAHWFLDQGFRSAIEHYLKMEREEVEQQIEHLTRFTPFKRK